MSAPDDLFAGGGELGELMRRRDWSATPLGPVEGWPRALRTCVRIMLTSRQPMFVWWGDELINLYNDAYRTIVGGKHPVALGQPASVVWREIWDSVGPRAASAMQQNEGTYDEALLLIMHRYGYPEETYYTFSYSPVPNDEGGTGGILCANTDDTQRIIGERRLALLRELAAAAGEARTVRDACALSARALATGSRDLPFALLYLHEPERNRMVLAGAAGLPPGHPAAPPAVELDATAPWPLGDVLRHRSAARDHRFLPGGHPARRRLGPPAVASRRPPALALRRVRPRWRVRRRAQSLPAVRRRLPRVPGAGRRADRGGDGQRPGLRGRARARRGAGRARPGEDRVLLQREPRVPHPAHPPARPVGGGARPLGPGRGAGRARADTHRAPERSSAAQAGEYPAGFRPHRGGAGEGELPPHRPPVAHGRAGLQLPVGGGADRPPLRGALPPARGAGLGGPRHVGEDRPQPRLQRFQVHLRRRDHGRAPRGRARSGADGRGHRHRHPRGRAAPALRAVPPGGWIAGPHPRGHRHRARAGPGAGAAARRQRDGRQRGRARQPVQGADPARHRALAGGAAGERRPAFGRGDPGGGVCGGSAPLAPLLWRGTARPRFRRDRPGRGNPPGAERAPRSRTRGRRQRRHARVRGTPPPGALRRAARRQRAGGASPRPRGAGGSGPERRHDAAARRLRSPAAAAGPSRDRGPARDPPLGAGRRRGEGRRPRGQRGRLHRQAVRRAGADGTGLGRLAPRARARRGERGAAGERGALPVADRGDRAGRVDHGPRRAAGRRPRRPSSATPA